MTGRTSETDAIEASASAGRKRERKLLGVRRKLLDTGKQRKSSGSAGSGSGDHRTTADASRRPQHNNNNNHGQHHHHHNPRIVKAESANSKYQKSKTPGRSRLAACKELLGAATLYWLCISAPALFGFVARFYEDYILVILDRLFYNTDAEVTAEEPASYYDLVSSYSSYYANAACDYLPQMVCSSPSEEELTAAQEADVGLLSSFLAMLYGDTGPMNDLLLVMVFAMILAMIRVVLVSLLVPRALAPRRLAALTRCKSSHILSSSAYEFSPAVAQKRVVRGSFVGNFIDDGGNEGFEGGTSRRLLGASDGEVGMPLIPSMDVGEVDGVAKAEEGESNVSVKERIAGWLNVALEFSYGLWLTVRAAIRRSLGHEPAGSYENLDATTTLRLFSAPRYATAIFRCLYCSASCLMAYLLFRSANFWPVYVGGKPTSSTRNCWDRSGSIAIGSLDSDFDHYNAALHIFFLAQGAYQLHSLWFHVLSMALLLVYEEGGERMVSMKSSMRSYLRPLTEHLISITLIVLCYIFSGLRRLGAVGIFTLESSSISLQLLQAFINAPESSWLRQPKMVKRLHRYLVVPSFLYCRFFVFPFIVWYSAAFESQDWLEQIEKAFMPGSALFLYIVFNVMIAFIFGLNLVFFRRLLFHPHVQEFIRQAREE